MLNTKHTVLNRHFLGEPGLAGCPLLTLVILTTIVLTGQTYTLCINLLKQQCRVCLQDTLGCTLPTYISLPTWLHSKHRPFLCWILYNYSL